MIEPTDDYKLQKLLNKSEPEPQEYWFSRQKQNQMVLDYASKLIIADSGITSEEAIHAAQDLVDKFYMLILKKTTKNYNHNTTRN